MEAPGGGEPYAYLRVDRRSGRCGGVTTQAIQVADLVAGIRRRVLEGDRRLDALGRRMAAVRSLSDNTKTTTHSGRRYTNEIVLF